ncbi:MAG: hypothetical protein QM813_03285 [Verrucomicrobiota bacterium]
MSNPNHLYLSLLPESLVASHLNPSEFGSYIATGSQKRTRGQGLFFKLTDAYAQQLITGDIAKRMAERHPRRSLYLSIYRVLENTPLEAFESLHLATDDGRVLSLQPAPVTNRIPGHASIYIRNSAPSRRVSSAHSTRKNSRNISPTRRILFRCPPWSLRN